MIPSSRLLLSLSLAALPLAVVRADELPAAAPGTISAEPDRATPVPLVAPRPLAIPPVARHTMANGMRLATIELERMGLVSVRWIFPYAGNATDPAGKDGLAGFVSNLVLKGAGTRDAADITLDLMGAGAGLSVSATRDFMEVTLTAEKGKLDEAMAIAADVLRRPTLPPDELERHRRRALDRYRQNQEKPEYWAGRKLGERLYGEHPYGKPVTEATLSGIARGDLAAFASSRVIPQDAVMGASGLTLDELKVLAERHFGDWMTPGSVQVAAYKSEIPDLAPEAASAVPSGPAWTIDLFDEPAKDQADMTLAFRTINEDHPDYPALRLAVELLGGGSLGRLYRNLREDKRWSYGAYGEIDSDAKAGAVSFEASVQKDKTGEALREVLAELARIKAAPVPDAELQTMKQYLYGSYVRGKEGVSALSASAASIELDRAPADRILTYRDRLFAITPAQILAAARTHLVREGIHVIVVGDARAVYPQLAPIGTVRVYGRDGAEIKDFGKDKQPPPRSAG